MLQDAFLHGKGLWQSMSFAQDCYNRELAGRLERVRAVARTGFGVGVSNHTIDQAATLRVVAVLAEFLV